MRNAKLVKQNILVPAPKRIVHEKLMMNDGVLIDWYYIDSPQSTVVVPVTENGNLIMIKQYRYNLRRFTLEFPSGIKRALESHETSAARELFEETGFQLSTDSLKKLGEYYVLPSETNRNVTFFIANPVVRISNPKLDDKIEKYFEIEVQEIGVSTALQEIGRSINGIETSMALMLAIKELKNRG